MNVEELVEEYKEKYSLEALVFKFIKWRKRFSDLSYIVLLFVTVVLVLSIPIALVLLDVSIAKITSIIYGTVLIITLASVAWFVYSAKKIIQKIHGIQPTDGVWRPKDFDNIQRKKIIQFLIEKNVYTPEKLRILTLELHKCIEKSKGPSIWGKGGGISSIIMTSFGGLIGYLFGKINGWNVEDVVLISLAVISGLILIKITIGTAQRIFFFNQDIFIPHNPNIIRAEFLQHVEDLLLVCEEPKEGKATTPIIIIP